MAGTLKNSDGTQARVHRGGRKADGLEVRATKRAAAQSGFDPEIQHKGVEP
jgi:hypothetical protein